MINVYARPTALHDVNGRIDYISSREKQEHLVATYDAADKSFWEDLAKHCQEQAVSAGHKKACEGREWHAALPNEYAFMYQGREEELAQELSELFEGITGTKNQVALHWNQSMTNFHFHVICSENKEVNEVTYGAELTRNTYYNAQGKRSTKKECTNEAGELLPGCKFYKKGDHIETVKRFGAKENLRDFKLNEAIKQALADKFNADLQENAFQTFKNDGIHVATQKVGKYTPEHIKREIEAKNRLVRAYNKTADEMLETAAHVNSKQAEMVENALRKSRALIKEHRGSNKWIQALAYCLEQMMLQLKKLRRFMQHNEDERELEPEHKGSLDERTKKASERVKKRDESVRSKVR